MRNRSFVLSALLFTAALATARSQTAAPATATDAPATAASTVVVTPPTSDTTTTVVVTPPADAAPATSTTTTTTEIVNTPAPVVSAKSKDASGKDTLSVDFPDTDIREILRNVADLFELNLVMPDTLQGKASIKLRDVTWRQIFDVVLKQVNFTFVEKDNIVKIVSMNDLQNEPFSTRTFTFENVSSASIMPLITPMLTPKRDATSPTTVAQPGGTVVNSEFANELIVTDQSTVLTRIGEMIKRLDAEPRQVVIETKFVEISKDDTKNREVALGYRNVKTGFEIGTGISDPTTNTIVGFPFSLLSGTLLGGSPTAVLNQNEFSVLVNILNAANNVRLVTNPTIVAINGSKSEIKIGRDLQLVTITTTTSGSTPVTTATAGEIKFVGISLEVTPQITGSKLISLKVKPSKSSIFRVKSFQGNDFYDIDKREGNLNIILRDGQTAAIGGLVDTITTKGNTKVPVLGDIPVLGSLFKSTKDITSEVNLVIFITATVLEPSKMKFENVVSRDQINSLQLTSREILGKNYQRSAEEASLQEQVGIVRQNKQDAQAIQELQKEISTETAPPNKN